LIIPELGKSTFRKEKVSENTLQQTLETTFKKGSLDSIE